MIAAADLRPRHAMAALGASLIVTLAALWFAARSRGGLTSPASAAFSDVVWWIGLLVIGFNVAVAILCVVMLVRQPRNITSWLLSGFAAMLVAFGSIFAWSVVTEAAAG